MITDIRPATKEDFELFYSDSLQFTVRAWVATIKGEPVAIVGLRYERKNAPMLFSEQTDHGQTKMTIWRASKALMTHVLQQYPNPWAVSSRGVSSDRLLEFFGFEYIDDSEHGKIYYRFNT